NLVAPQLSANGLRHAERVDVEDSAADAELRHVLHHRDPLETDCLEMRGHVGETMHAAFAQLEPEISERAWHARLLEQRARRGDEETELAARQPFEGVDALARDLHVRLRFAESLAWRIQRDRRRIEQGVEVGEPALRLGQSFGGDDEEARRETA